MLRIIQTLIVDRFLRSGLMLVGLFCVAVGSGVAVAANGREAILSIESDRPLIIAPMNGSPAIHSNRDYQFINLPAEVDGLQFTSHEHRNPGTIRAKVLEEGLVYAVIEGGDLPESLGMGGGWTACGVMEDTVGAGLSSWFYYRKSFNKGAEFLAKTNNRWGTILAARSIEGAPPLAPFDDIRREYEAIAEQIAAHHPEEPTYRETNMRLRREAASVEALIMDEDRDPLDVVLRRTRALYGDLRAQAGPEWDTERLLAKALEALESKVADAGLSNYVGRYLLFREVCALRRRIAFSNPLLDFDRLIFLTHHRAQYEHMVDQYFGFHARSGGGLYVLNDPFGDSPTVTDLLATATVANGRLAGQPLAGGSFISLDLDYDGRSVLFAWTEGRRTISEWTPHSTYHVFRYDLETERLTQLTDGVWNDFDPCFLPSGRIVFISERRGGFLRCGERPDPTYTLFGMMADGSDIIPLSFHETHEWHPSVNNDGMLVYTRWDYVDRDSDIAHHLWLCYPDGRDPRSYHGNYPVLRESRPWMEMSIRAIPDSHRYVAVSAPHHGQAYGSLVMIDHRPEDDDEMSQVRRLTPEAMLPESERAPGEPYLPKGRNLPGTERYGAPWPLSEKYYLAVFDQDARHYGIYLIDVFGNRELIWRDPVVPCLDPMPLRPRKRPPVIPVRTRQAAVDLADEGTTENLMATIAVMNVYDSDFSWPHDSEIQSLRVIQLFPKATPAQLKPNIGVGDQSLARGVLGTVPVERDGSAYFEAPVGVPIYFQALDANGLAVQTMRSDTYVHPGEQMTCQGCHEPKRRIAGTHSRRPSPLALQRPPSLILPEADGAWPLTFPRLVQDVLDRNCADCHAKEAKAPDLSAEASGPYGWSKAYQALSPLAWAKHGGNGALYDKNGSSRSEAGQVGARASRLYRLLAEGHHGVNLSEADFRRITLWIDCNSNFYGAYLNIQAQTRGEIVFPSVY